jgi:Tfp pilus assembly protein PilO
MTDVRRILSENRRVAWIIAGALAINVALYALIVYPLSQRVQSGQEEAGAATRELVAARREHDAARNTVTGKKQADEELQRFYKEVLPPDLSGARRLLYPLDQLARNANLEMIRSRFAEEPDRFKTGLAKLAVTLEFTGEYTNIRNFIHELETAPEFLVLEDVSVGQATGDDQGLTVTARVATYFRTAANGN